jgi:hypothetical protein
MIITLSFTKVGQDRVSDLLGSSSMAQDSSGNYGGGGGPWVMDCPSQAEERNLVTMNALPSQLPKPIIFDAWQAH